jgi:hypothetical protein
MIGLRRALALLILSFFTIQFAMTGWLGPDELQAMYVGLALCYGLAFVAVAAEWFWGRWFAMGVGNFGSLMLLVLIKVGFEPIFVFFGVSHLLVTLCLTGEGMAAKYEYSEATAERWNFQEESLVLMRRAVKSAGSTIPLLILYGLAPRPEAVQLTAVGLGIAGLFGLLRGRTWGVMALGAAGLLALADGLGLFGAPPTGYLLLTPTGGPIVYGAGVALLAALALAVPAVYARTFARYLKRA